MFPKKCRNGENKKSFQLFYLRHIQFFIFLVLLELQLSYEASCPSVCSVVVGRSFGLSKFLAKIF